MKTGTARIDLRLSITPEKLTLVLLVGQSVAMGYAFALLYTVSNALFLVDFGSKALPFAFLATAVVVPFGSYLFSWAQKRLEFPALVVVTLFLITALFFVTWAGFTFRSARWLSFVLLVGYTLAALLSWIVRNAQAGFLFDARRLKQVFPLFVGGEIGGLIIGGVTSTFFADLLGSTENTLLVAGASMVLYSVLAVVTVRRHRAELTLGGTTGRTGRERPKLGRLLRKRYVVLVLLYQILSAVGTQLAYYLCLEQAETVYTTPEALTNLFGTLMAAATGLTLLFVVLLSGRLLTRFGIGLGLAGNPVGVGIALAGAAVVGAVWGEKTTAFFWLVLAAELADVILTSGLTDTSVQSSYQPLQPEERTFVQTLVEGVGIPLAYGLSGACLLLFTLVKGMTTIHTVLFTLGVTVVWTAVALLLQRRYGEQLEQAMRRRRIGEADLSLADRSSLAVVERLTGSSDAEEVLLGLELLDQAQHPSLAARLTEALARPEARVRRKALAGLERLKPAGALAAVRQLLAGESDPSVRPQAVRALCALCPEEPEEIAPYLREAEDPEVRCAAIVGLCRHGEAGGAVTAARALGALVSSPEEDAKVRLARMLGEIGSRSLYAPLLPLLADPSTEVRREALRAAARLAHRRLWPLVIANLSGAATRMEAMQALAFSGEELVPLLKERFESAGGPEADGHGKMALLRLIRICSRSRNPGLLDYLATLLEHPDPDLQTEILRSLSLSGYQAAVKERGRVEAVLDVQARCGFRILAAWEALAKLSEKCRSEEEPRSAATALALLLGALEDELAVCRRRIFSLLSFLYDRKVVCGAEQRLLSGLAAQRGLALELLDVILPRPLKRLLLPLLDDSRPREARVGELAAALELPRSGAEEILSEMISAPALWPSAWIRTCALYAASSSWLAARPFAGRKAGSMALTPDNMAIIEKVIVLKRAEVFDSIPDHVLAFIASIAEDVELGRGECLIHKGEIGDCMYLIVEGRMLVHEGERRIAELGRGQTVGELAVLDPEPRSATVSALEEARLYRIDKEAFDELMADQPEISRGVIQVLCRRLRAASELSNRSASPIAQLSG